MTACLGIDTGGTFTDFVLLEADQVRTHKVLSSPEAPEKAILRGIDEMALEEAMRAGELVIVHGTTVATNAVLEGRGARTVFVTNSGLEDLLCIARQTRPALYDLCPPAGSGELDPELMLGVETRRDADGAPVVPLTDNAIERLLQRVRAREPEAVAINLLFSYLAEDEEKHLAEALEAEGLVVCRSSRVLPLAGEYERGVATWLNARLAPGVARYIQRLDNLTGASPLSIMQSHGGTIGAGAAGEQAVNLLLSGPAGGLCAARQLSDDLGTDRMMTFDMGGTSTDVALIDGDFRRTLEGRVGPWPVAVPMVEMHTIGAGGGSLARLDEAGMLHVGPESAGAEPGPACYDRGGTEPTVTDAHLVLGRLQPEFALGGGLALSRQAGEEAVQALAAQSGLSPEATAGGVLDLANDHMAQALRVISIQKGHDPADFTLISFGGAGGLHVCALAEALGMHQAAVPANSGVLSAQGLARAPRQRELIQALPARVDTDSVQQLARGLTATGEEELRNEGVTEPIDREWLVDLCYQGQSFHLDIPWDGDTAAAERAFHERHEQRYGHRLELPVEWVHVRVRLAARQRTARLPALPSRATARPSARVAMPGQADKVPVFERDQLAPGQALAGPALICEALATTWLAPLWSLEVSPAGHLLLQRQRE